MLLGLALTEALGRLARALKSRRHVRIGWSTALLGILVACDVVTFWVFGWQIRTQITPTWPMMFVGFIFTSAYYVAASLVFPENADEDHDAHFAANYRLVLGGIFVCNAVLFGWIVYLVGIGHLFSLRQIVISCRMPCRHLRARPACGAGLRRLADRTIPAVAGLDLSRNTAGLRFLGGCPVITRG